MNPTGAGSKPSDNGIRAEESFMVRMVDSRRLGPPGLLTLKPKSPQVVGLLAKVERHLTAGQPAVALEWIERARLLSPWLANAAGVCHLRLGNAQLAVDIYRKMLIESGGLLLRDDWPAIFKTNYATALLAAGNVAGCRSILGGVPDKQNEVVQRLHASIRRWQASFTLWERLRWWLGGPMDRPVDLDFPLGELE